MIDKLKELKPTRHFIIPIKEYLNNCDNINKLTKRFRNEHVFIEHRLEQLGIEVNDNTYVCILVNTSDYITWWYVQHETVPTIDVALKQLIDFYEKYDVDFVEYLENYRQKDDFSTMDFRVEYNRCNITYSLAQSLELMYDCNFRTIIKYLING